MYKNENESEQIDHHIIVYTFFVPSHNLSLNIQYTHHIFLFMVFISVPILHMHLRVKYICNMIKRKYFYIHIFRIYFFFFFFEGGCIFNLVYFTLYIYKLLCVIHFIN